MISTDTEKKTSIEVDADYRTRPGQDERVFLESDSSTNHDEEESSSLYHDDVKDANNETRNPAIAKNETKAVCGVRILVFGVLVASMTAVTVLVYFALRNSESNAFEEQFHEDSTKVLASLGLSLDLTLGGLDAMVVNMASEAKASNQTWPFVTIPDFAVRAEKTRSVTNALYLNIYTYVETDQRDEWQTFCAENGPQWVKRSQQLQKQENLFPEVADANIPIWNVIWDYSEFDKDESEWGTIGLDPNASGPFMPMWYVSPLPATPSEPAYNWDLLSVVFNESIVAVLDTHKVSLTEAYMIAYPNDTEALEQIEYDAEWFGSFITTGEEPREPISDVHYPILADGSSRINVMADDYDPKEHHLGGFLTAPIYWRDHIKGILPNGSNGIVIVFDNPCNPSFTYQINGPYVQFLGTGDQHEQKFNYLEKISSIHNLDEFSIRGSKYSGIPINEEVCPFTIRIYPSTTMEDSYLTVQPVLVTIAVVLIFVVTSAVFILYDICVEKRQKLVMKTAMRSSAIVSSLFPSNVHDRLMEQQKEMHKADRQEQSRALRRITNNDKHTSDVDLSTKPIADLFPEATILFADLVGFTAWSSNREPTQVFTLLETLYSAFDAAARRRGIFKVETVGDCYVAVAGLPEPRKNHAVALCRFAAEIRQIMNQLTTELELTLGPGTSDLQLRCGLHSGSVTAGVLRGEKSRFQLFGDTVNTAARMESNGIPNRIHISQKTADLLIEAGKSEWLQKRKDLVIAKGKGSLQTFLVEPRGRMGNGALSETGSSNNDDYPIALVEESGPDGAILITKSDNEASAEINRLIDWQVSLFTESLREVAAQRQAVGTNPYIVGNDKTIAKQSNAQHTSEKKQPDAWNLPDESCQHDQRQQPRDELVASIDFPIPPNIPDIDSDMIQLPPSVLQQLYHYVFVIAHLHRQSNDFHNFSRACHVTMSVKKLLQQITASSKKESPLDQKNDVRCCFATPIVQVAVLFSCLIHDVDHPGVPNRQLVDEHHELATRYQHKSITEQNSVNTAWLSLLDGSHDDLCTFLFPSKSEFQLFRQIVVNTVMATDLLDPDLKVDREKRLELAFPELTTGGGVEKNIADNADSNELARRNRKVTILLEYLIQAADVAHAMQHWSIYQKWSRNLFGELYRAYQSGRAPQDPNEVWYRQELEFLDHHVIPVAHKLKQGLFLVAGGVAEDEFQEMLDRAYENRLEWEQNGHSLLAEMKTFFDNNNQRQIVEV